MLPYTQDRKCQEPAPTTPLRIKAYVQFAVQTTHTPFGQIQSLSQSLKSVQVSPKQCPDHVHFEELPAAVGRTARLDVDAGLIVDPTSLVGFEIASTEAAGAALEPSSMDVKVVR